MAPPPQLHGAAVHARPPSLTIAAPIVDLKGRAWGLVADRRQAVLSLQGVGTFGIADGSRVDYEADPDAEAGMVEAYLKSTVSALLFAQRGRFALHANSVEVRGRSVAIAGRSGAGKSTTAIRLLQRGHRHLTDDFALLEPGADAVVLHPTDRGLRLWPATADLLGVDITAAVRPVATSEKVVLSHPTAEPTHLRAVTVIKPGEGAVRLDRLHGGHALAAVLDNAYRIEILQRIWPRELFAWAAAVAAVVPAFAVTRPADGWTVDAVADCVEAALDTDRSTLPDA
jgi:hypothetical protein